MTVNDDRDWWKAWNPHTMQIPPHSAYGAAELPSTFEEWVNAKFDFYYVKGLADMGVTYAEFAKAIDIIGIVPFHEVIWRIFVDGRQDALGAADEALKIIREQRYLTVIAGVDDDELLSAIIACRIYGLDLDASATDAVKEIGVPMFVELASQKVPTNLMSLVSAGVDIETAKAYRHGLTG